MKIYNEWKLAQSDGTNLLTDFFDAEVPGQVQLDYGKHMGLPDYLYSDNVKQYSLLSEYYWIYETVIPDVDLKDRKLFFVSKGIEYKFEISVDDILIHEQEGMFTYVNIEIKPEYMGKNMKIKIFPAPKRADAENKNKEVDASFKPAVGYGWDFHPRLITLGIWDETYFETRSINYLDEALFTYELNEDRTEAAIKLETKVSGAGDLEFTLVDDEGKVVLSDVYPSDIVEKEYVLKNPKLWWCHNYGTPTRYTMTVKLIVDNETVNCVQKKVGFRRVKLIPQECNWYLDRFPFTQAFPPITIELNGVEIFAKGMNWVPPEIFVSKITKKRYDDMLKEALGLHANILRCWGGAIINKEDFFDLADEYGILIWQEFPLACNCYKDRASYLRVAEIEATNIIRRLREHPCITIWCGGNELFVGGSAMTPQFHVIRLLNSLCYRLDKNTPFLDTSPMVGMRHGHYTFRNTAGEECFNSFYIVQATAYCEFGCPSVANYEVLERIIPKEQLNLESIDREDSSWVVHSMTKAWTNDSWYQKSNIEHYFGKIKNLKDAIFKSQLLQCTGFKGMFEEARRQKQNCNIAMNWCLNEPWPTAANNSIISYPLDRKPAYYAVENSLRDVVASARFKKFSWVEGEVFKAEIFLLNDGFSDVKPGFVNVYVRINGIKTLIMKWEYGAPQKNKNVIGNTAAYVLPKAKSGIMELILEADNEEYSNSYQLLYYDKETAKLAENMKEKPMDFDGIKDYTIGVEGVDIELK